LVSSGSDPATGYCEHVSEASGSIKGMEFIDEMSDYQLLDKDSAS
jgi:hypothetical protein